MTRRQLGALDAAGLAVTLVTLLCGIVWGFPLIWTVAASLGLVPNGDIGSPAEALGLYAQVLFESDIGRWYLNSLVTAGGVTLLVLAISAPCAYAISQMKFRGRTSLWLLILASFVIPVQALIISHFFLMYNLGLINTWLGVILPQLIAPVAVIIYKQFFDRMPREFREAAAMDGASHAAILFRIYLPINWGVTAALAIITFIGAWNAFLWPFLAVTRTPMMNLSVAMGQSFSGLGPAYLAGSVLAALPMAIVYLLFQRRITDSVVMSASIKG